VVIDRIQARKREHGPKSCGWHLMPRCMGAVKATRAQICGVRPAYSKQRSQPGSGAKQCLSQRAPALVGRWLGPTDQHRCTGDRRHRSYALRGDVGRSGRRSTRRTAPVTGPSWLRCAANWNSFRCGENPDPTACWQ
jgi:hypothetical protein